MTFTVVSESWLRTGVLVRSDQCPVTPGTLCSRSEDHKRITQMNMSVDGEGDSFFHGTLKANPI